MGKDSSEIKKQMKDEKMATFPRKLVTKEGGRERERKKKKQFQKEDTELRDFLVAMCLQQRNCLLVF